MHYMKNSFITTLEINDHINAKSIPRFVLWTEDSAEELQWIFVFKTTEKRDCILITQNSLRIRLFFTPDSCFKFWRSAFPDAPSMELPFRRDAGFDYPDTAGETRQSTQRRHGPKIFDT